MAGDSSVLHVLSFKGSRSVGKDTLLPIPAPFVAILLPEVAVLSTILDYKLKLNY